MKSALVLARCARTAAKSAAALLAGGDERPLGTRSARPTELSGGAADPDPRKKLDGSSRRALYDQPHARALPNLTALLGGDDLAHAIATWTKRTLGDRPYLCRLTDIVLALRASSVTRSVGLGAGTE